MSTGIVVGVGVQFAGIPLAERLLNEISWLTGESDVACSRVGARGSILTGGSEAVANTVDAVRHAGIPCISACDGTTTQCDTSPANWSNASANITASAQRITAVSPTKGEKYFHQHAVSIGETWTAVLDVTLVSGDATGFVVGLGEAGGLSLEVVALDGLSAGETTTIIATGTTTTTAVRIVGLQRNSDTGSGSCVVDIANARLVPESAAYPPAPDGSAAGTSYGVDLVTRPSIAYPSAGTLIVAFVPLDWDGFNHPENAGARLFKAWYEVACAPIQIIGEVATTEQAIEGVNVVFADWNGDTVGIEANGGIRVTNASNRVPSGDAILFNHSAGANRVGHCGGAIGYVDRVLTSDERTALRGTLVGRLTTLLCLTLCVQLWGDSLSNDIYHAPSPEGRAAYIEFTDRAEGGESAEAVHARWDASDGEYNNGDGVFIMLGRNDVRADRLPAARQHLAEMVSDLTHERYLIGPVYPAQYDSVEQREAVDEHNRMLAVTYGAHFIDTHKLLVDAYESTNDADVAAVGLGLAPPSLLRDEVHANDAGKSIIANALAERFAAMA